jgi:UDP-glucose:(glucosyl)LPS alpha-1,2-glucosyltransferase
MSGFEENEISIKANGGTELVKRKLASMLPESLLEDFQIICSRTRDLDENKIRILWCHDLPEDPESKNFRDTEWRNKFHKFVFVSNWQYSRYNLIHGLPMDDKSIVLDHGITPAPASCLEKPDDGKIHLVYTSTPQRGLAILVPVFEHLAETNPDIHLHVYSSFKIYGWEEADKQFEELYETIRNHPQMTYHGFTPNEQLREELNKYHIFAYPSIWTETSCIAMLEAMSAGLVCVHSNLGALPETSGGLNVMYNVNMEDVQKHAGVFAGNLQAAIRLVRDKKQDNMIAFNKVYVDNKNNVEFIKNKWEVMLNDLKAEYPDEESRKFPKEMFVYKV